MLGFFAAEFEGFFADLGGALEEIEAAIVLGEAFAGDLDAFDIDFDLVVALNVARKKCEVGAGGIGSGGALEELAFEGGCDGGIKDGIVPARCGSFGCIELVSSFVEPAAMLEAPEGGDVRFETEAFGRRLGDFFRDFGRGHFEEPVVELVELLGGEGGQGVHR